ncbi:hypothetical protein Hanom_Chr13g01239461 [Helianthus anomalus]
MFLFSSETKMKEKALCSDTRTVGLSGLRGLDDGTSLSPYRIGLPGSRFLVCRYNAVIPTSSPSFVKTLEDGYGLMIAPMMIRTLRMAERVFLLIIVTPLMLNLMFHAVYTTSLTGLWKNKMNGHRYSKNMLTVRKDEDEQFPIFSNNSECDGSPLVDETSECRRILNDQNKNDSFVVPETEEANESTNVGHAPELG